MTFFTDGDGLISGLLVVVMVFVLMLVSVVVVLCWFCGSVVDCGSNGGGFGDGAVVCVCVGGLGLVWWGLVEGCSCCW